MQAEGGVEAKGTKRESRSAGRGRERRRSSIAPDDVLLVHCPGHRLRILGCWATRGGLDGQWLGIFRVNVRPDRKRIKSSFEGGGLVLQASRCRPIAADRFRDPPRAAAAKTADGPSDVPGAGSWGSWTLSIHQRLLLRRVMPYWQAACVSRTGEHASGIAGLSAICLVRGQSATVPGGGRRPRPPRESPR